ncbi:MAG: elongation factor G [Candidatus Poribacteria bacterium]|nr:MAG: elongation factor G [Candidatus Poribacteria bacterium]
MKQYTSDRIRNVVVAAHAKVGKTKFIEAALYTAGAVRQLGSVQAGTTVSDFDPDEIARKTTLSVTPCIAEWRDHKVNLLDTPGYEEFFGELESALSAGDAVVILLHGEHGVEGGTERIWDTVERFGLPRAFVVNHLDGENADFEKALASVEENFGVRPVRVHLPVGMGADFKGVVDLVRMKALLYGEDGKTVTESEIPDDLSGVAEEARELLVEAAAESDDELIEKYLEAGTLSDQELARGLRAAFQEGTLVPALCCSPDTGIGVSAVLDFIVNCFPSAAERKVTAFRGEEPVELTGDPSGPLVARVFKTIFDPFSGRMSLFRVFSGTLRPGVVRNVTQKSEERINKLYWPHGKEHLEAPEIVAGDIGAVAKLEITRTGDTLAAPDNPLLLPPIEFSKPTYTLAVFPEREGDDERLMSALQRLHEEDPTFVVQRNEDTKEMTVSGLGDQHLTIMLARAKRKFNAGARTAPPKVAYRETITKPVQNVEYTHKKQTGGAGQYAKVVITIEPLPRGGGYEFVDEIFGGAIDQQFRPSVDKGIQNVMKEGILAGFPIVDVRVRLVDGKTHPVDSKDIAFQIAGREAFIRAFQQAAPVLLEPIMKVDILCPEENMGDVIGDINGRRGAVVGMEQVGKRQLIHALIPLAELSRYQTDLKSLTSARGSFTMSFSHYQEVPRELQDRLLEQLRSQNEK